MKNKNKNNLPKKTTTSAKNMLVKTNKIKQKTKNVETHRRGITGVKLEFKSIEFALYNAK